MLTKCKARLDTLIPHFLILICPKVHSHHSTGHLQLMYFCSLFTRMTKISTKHLLLHSETDSCTSLLVSTTLRILETFQSYRMSTQTATLMSPNKWLVMMQDAGRGILLKWLTHIVQFNKNQYSHLLESL